MTVNWCQPPALIVEIQDIPAGIAIRERGGFRFVAVDQRFRLLDGSRFRRFEQLTLAARRIFQAASGQEARPVLSHAVQEPRSHRVR